MNTDVYMAAQGLTRGSRTTFRRPVWFANGFLDRRLHSLGRGCEQRVCWFTFAGGHLSGCPAAWRTWLHPSMMRAIGSTRGFWSTGTVCGLAFKVLAMYCWRKVCLTRSMQTMCRNVVRHRTIFSSEGQWRNSGSRSCRRFQSLPMRGSIESAAAYVSAFRTICKERESRLSTKRTRSWPGTGGSSTPSMQSSRTMSAASRR